MSPLIISDSARLADFAAALADAPGIAMDTEFMRERTYRPQLCLLQLAANGTALCVDPLADLPLESLRPALSRPSAQKILHAARQDLEVLWPVFGPLHDVYDTQIAAGLAGLPAQVGYSELVRRLLGIDLPKGQTRTDWARRPLTEAQVQYAVDDVLHLPALRDLLDEQLDKLGRRGWLEEELADLSRADRLFVDPDKAWERLKWAGELDPDRLRLAQALAAWRERRAIDRDRPRSWILDDSGLRGIVMRVPRTPADLATVPDLTPGFVERSGEAMLGLIEEAKLPSVLPPPSLRQRPDAELQSRVKRLGNAVQEQARGLSLAPELLATRRDLERIARGTAIGEALPGWRGTVLGDALAAAV
jgi:ribonuclease D